MIILLLLRKLIKNDNAFLITIAVITVIALGLKFFGPFYSWGFIRGASSIPVGILIAKLPRLRLKKQWLIWFPLSLVFALCFVIVCFGLGDVEWFGFRIPELILDNLLYPALIYLTFSLNVRCKFFTYLGALSFGLYAFQCPADLLRLLGVSNLGLLFGFIVLATLIDDTAKRFFRRLADRQ